MLLGAVGLEEFNPRRAAEQVFIACGALQGQRSCQITWVGSGPAAPGVGRPPRKLACRGGMQSSEPALWLSAGGESEGISRAPPFPWNTELRASALR